jgi:rhamnose utilization protein RhaD (predicted bifunctional aldolase and dehydrogenase)
MLKISDRIKRRPDFSDEIKELCDASFAAIPGSVSEIIKTLQELAGSVVVVRAKELTALVRDKASFAPVSSAFTPDHIVYAGSDPLFTEANNEASLKDAWKNHADKTGRAPRIIAVQGLGVFFFFSTEKAALLAVDLFVDSVKVAVYAGSFGGPLAMPQEHIDFINNWEVERYRSSVST